MKIPFYNYSVDSDHLIFEFESISLKKSITKRIVYSEIAPQSRVYNLLLGDLQDDGSFTDMSITNNADMEKVLATVLHSIIDFFELHSDCIIYFTGSNPSRTRFYRIAIANYMNEFHDLFVIYGVNNNIPELFEPNKNYEAYLISWID